ncbi:MAG: T9SS type A sorting domain-containing protein [Chitinispirillia bacterium]|nr:T9SS type A sorting domain-containing protein [Chitinispirillia bacterium]
MLRKVKAVSAMIAAAGMAICVMAQSPPPQDTQDSAEGTRLTVNGKSLFASGMNVAWVSGNSFGNDVGDVALDAFAFRSHVQAVRKAGGNSLRWWLHTDFSNCPKINDQGVVSGIGSQTVNNIKTALDIAYENGVALILCLFSFDMLVPGDGGKGTSYYPNYTLEGNHRFLSGPASNANLDSYFENALRPILAGVGNHPAIMAWEVFNEAEGMLAAENWSHVMRKISFEDILRVTNRVAGEVRRGSKKMVSTGIKEASYLRAGNSRGQYSTANLIAAGGDDDGWLDFYMVHYYPQWQGTTGSPFHNPASHWGADRPIVIAEFPGRDWGPGTAYREVLVNDPGTPADAVQRADEAAMTVTQAFQYAFQNGYAGALSWALTDPSFGRIEETGPAMKWLYDNHKDAVLIKEVTIEDLTGDLVMKLTANSLPVLSADWAELGTNFEGNGSNFSGSTNITFDIFVQAGSGSNLDINVVMKVGRDWDWTQIQTLKLADYTPGQWVTVTVPIGTSVSLSQVRSLLFQYGSTGTPFTGTIFFDNVRIGTNLISDFDDAKAWGLMATSASAVDIVTRASVGGTSVIGQGKFSSASALRAPTALVRGKTLRVTSPDNSDLRIKMINVQGRTVRTFKAKGSADFSLKKVPAGRYIVEIKKAGNKVSTTSVTVK